MKGRKISFIIKMNTRLEAVEFALMKEHITQTNESLKEIKDILKNNETRCDEHKTRII
jgi:HD-GYP domain-containing protein (c-di-GMP phosphodiesterase class II)